MKGYYQMNNYIIHDYIDNRSDLLSYLNKIKYKNPHYLLKDVEDGHLSNYEMINNTILVANNNTTTLSGNVYNFAGLFRKMLTSIRIHAYFCNNTHKGLFKTINNKDCGFYRKELFDYLSNDPEAIENHTNLFFEMNSGVKMNTEVAFRNHDHEFNKLNINLLNIFNRDHDNYKNKVFFVNNLKRFFLRDYEELPKMNKEYLSLCDISYYKSLQVNQDQDLSVVEEKKELPIPKNNTKACEIWKNAIAVMISMDRTNKTWLEGTTPHDYDFQHQTFTVTCANEFVQEMVDTRLRKEIEPLISNQLDKEMKIEIL